MAREPDDLRARLAAYHATHGRAACSDHAADLVCPRCVHRHAAAMTALGLDEPPAPDGNGYAPERTVEPARVSSSILIPRPGGPSTTTGPALPFDREALMASVWQACQGREWVSVESLNEHFGNHHASDRAMNDAIIFAMAALIDEGRLVRLPVRYAPRGEP